MNDNLILSKLVATPNGQSTPSLLSKAMAQTDPRGLIATLYLSILSRNPTDAETTAGLALIGSRTGL